MLDMDLANTLCKVGYTVNAGYSSHSDDLEGINVANIVAATILEVVIGHFIPPKADDTLPDDFLQSSDYDDFLQRSDYDDFVQSSDYDDFLQRSDYDDFVQRIEKEKPETLEDVIDVVAEFTKDPATLETVCDIIEPEKLKTPRERVELVEEIISTTDGLRKDPYGLKDDTCGNLANEIGETVVKEVANYIKNINTSKELKEKLHKEEYHKLEEIYKNQQKKHPTTTLTEKKWWHFWKK